MQKRKLDNYIQVLIVLGMKAISQHFQLLIFAKYMLLSLKGLRNHTFDKFLQYSLLSVSK